MSENALKRFSVEQLDVQVFQDRVALGRTAAKHAIQRIVQLQQEKDEVRIIFAAAPSQNEFLAALTESSEIDWSRVIAFHMDEYIGLEEEAPQAFSRFLCERLFDIVRPGTVHFIESSRPADEECKRYTQLLSEKPIDVVCLGIGENGHIAFNDPPVADFEDKQLVKQVELEHACRQQQVNDGCFPQLDAVPTHAITLTIPAIIQASHLYCMVPGKTKRNAVTETLNSSIGTHCPATILRTHPDCALYVDQDSYDYNAWV